MTWVTIIANPGICSRFKVDRECCKDCEHGRVHDNSECGKSYRHCSDVHESRVYCAPLNPPNYQSYYKPQEPCGVKIDKGTWHGVTPDCCDSAGKHIFYTVGNKFECYDDGFALDLGVHDSCLVNVYFCPWCGSKLPDVETVKEWLERETK